MVNDPVPQRLSDSERDAAIEMLREHLTAGHLEEVEFTERMQQALAARVAPELAEIFEDLPDPRPELPSDIPATPVGFGAPSATGYPGAAIRPRGAAPAPVSQAEWPGIAQKVVWPVAIVLAIISGKWVIFIALAIVASIVLSQLGRQRREPPPY